MLCQQINSMQQSLMYIIQENDHKQSILFCYIIRFNHTMTIYHKNLLLSPIDTESGENHKPSTTTENSTNKWKLFPWAQYLG